MIDKSTPVVVLRPKIKINHPKKSKIDFKFQIEEIWEIGNYEEKYAVLFDPVLDVALAIIETDTLNVLKVNKHIFDNQNELPIDIEEFDNSKDERKVFLRYTFSVKYGNRLIFPLGFIYYGYVKRHYPSLHSTKIAVFDLEKSGREDYSELEDIDPDYIEDYTQIDVINYETKETVYVSGISIHYNFYFMHNSISEAEAEIIEIKPKSGILVLDPNVQIAAMGVPYIPKEGLDDPQLTKYVGLTLYDSIINEIEREVEYSESVDTIVTIDLFTEAKYEFHDIMVSTFKSVVENANRDSGEEFSALYEFEELLT